MKRDSNVQLNTVMMTKHLGSGPTLTLGGAVSLLFCVVTFGQGQDSPSSPPSSPTVAEVTATEVNGALKQLEDSQGLEEATRTRLKDLFTQAKRALDDAVEPNADATKFKSWIDSAEKDLREAKRQLELPPAAYDLTSAESLDLEALLAERAALDQKLADERKTLVKAQEEPRRRLERNGALPGDISEAQLALEEIETQLKAATPDNDPPAVFQARTLLLRARWQKQRAIASALENERDAYIVQGDLPRLQADLATARVQQREQDITQLVGLITQRRKRDAAAQRNDAKAQLQELQSAPKALQVLAQHNVDVAQRRFDLADEIRDATVSRDAARYELERWQTDFTRTKKRADVESAESLGEMLLKRRASLPRSFSLRQDIAARANRIRALQAEIYELEDRRSELTDMRSATATALAVLDKDDLSSEVELSVEELLQLEKRILDTLIADASREYNLHNAAQDDQRALARLVADYQAFIAAEVFWLRSSAPLHLSDVKIAGEALSWLFAPASWRDVGKTLGAHLWSNPVEFFFVAGLIALLFFYRRRMIRQLEDLGRDASSISCRTIKPTLRALILTALLAAPLAILVWYFGRALADSSDELVRSVSFALRNLAVGILTLKTVEHVSRPQGLAEAHFGSSARAMSILRSSARAMLLVGIPLAFVCIVLERQANPAYRSSLGRFALIAILLVVTFVLYRTLSPKRGVLQELFEQNQSRWLVRLQRIWVPAIVLFPVALAVLSAMGFNYTSFQLTGDFWNTFALAFPLWLFGALLFRCIRVKRRQLRWEQLMEARKRATEGDEFQSSEIDDLVNAEEEVDLVAMDQQTRRLVVVLVGFIGLVGAAAIWVDVIPALGPAFNYGLWSVEGVGGIAEPITVGAVLLAALVAGFAIVASRNLPGLVDALLLGRLGIESSLRYAITTLSRYTIVVIGVLVGCHLVGLSWSKAQWLIAALGVGLGFGLQEIVANFVCGILLLFERPIRVGDTVTLGDTTGVVVRIRTRATTVRNWDRQEVVIPNKELITGRIINWSLSDQVNRILLQVGIAYGSDTTHARQLLEQIVKENPNVVEEPRPRIIFEQFGDSTLNFTIRAYLDNLDNRLETTHELHTAINQRFAEEGIEIAFPQRDLHVRSVDQSIPLGDIGQGCNLDDETSV